MENVNMIKLATQVHRRLESQFGLIGTINAAHEKVRSFGGHVVPDIHAFSLEFLFVFGVLLVPV